MKLKEKILKLGKRKNCFIALLLLALLAFSVLGGFNGAKSAKTEVNALTAPQSKNLDLNGIRYTYQTSLSELRNSYGLLNGNFNKRFIQIHESSEGYNNVIFNASKDYIYNINSTMEENRSSLDNATEVFLDTFSFYKGNEIIEDFYNSTPSGTIDNKEIALINPFDIDEITSFEFKIQNYLTNVNNDVGPWAEFTNFSGGYIVNFLYTSLEDINNTILKSYALSQPIDYKFNIQQMSGYKLRLITIAFSRPLISNINSIPVIVPDDYIDDSEAGYVKDGYITIDNVNFIQNNNANIITFDSDFTQKYIAEGSPTELPVYKGNILLSETKYDKQLFNLMENTFPRPKITVPFYQDIYFGGNFNNKYPLNNVYYYALAQSKLYLGGFRKNYDNFTDLSDSLFYKGFNDEKITYQGQNRLLFLSGTESLITTYQNTRYDALSAQVEDVLYNVNYVGDVEEIEFNEKVEEDFENLLKITGLGAFIGLIIGLLFGNPLLGAAIGALWGFLIGVFPLLIDGLQAIFGKNAFQGLYNFFKSITQFFANFVDTIINFLISIITNPFVLVLIVIVAIVWVVIYLQKK